MTKISFIVLGMLCISFCTVNDATQDGGFRYNRNLSGPMKPVQNDKFADGRINANYIAGHPDYTVTSKRSKTKAHWKYQHGPRSDSLFIRTESGKVLYPGELNTVRNAVKFEDFMCDFHIKLPNAKENTEYAYLLYSEEYLIRALINLKGEDLYNGIKGAKMGDVFEDTNEEELKKAVVTSTRYCAEILEQSDHLPNMKGDLKSEWKNNPVHNSLKQYLNGKVGKTCFVVLPKGVPCLDNDFYNEFEMIIETFEYHLNQESDNGVSDIITDAFNEALRLQRKSLYVGRPNQNYLYTDNNNPY